MNMIKSLYISVVGIREYMGGCIDDIFVIKSEVYKFLDN